MDCGTIPDTSRPVSSWQELQRIFTVVAELAVLEPRVSTGSADTVTFAATRAAGTDARKDRRVSMTTQNDARLLLG
jgi:hypothetical protein